MRWLITGANGLLGSALRRVLATEDLIALTRQDLDITDSEAVAAIIDQYRPSVVINAAADKRADAAEDDDTNAQRVNALAPGYLAKACIQHNAVCVHISADYVFDGAASTPYSEADDPRPLSAYGRSKLAGEREVLQSGAQAYVVRTSWLYGGDAPNFVKSMLKLERERDTLTVVGDQHGSPTWTHQLAEGLVALARLQPQAGIYHCTNTGHTTWHGFARAVFEERGADPERVKAITTDQLQQKAPRPHYSVLDTSKWAQAGLPPMLPWREALHQAFVAGEFAS